MEGSICNLPSTRIAVVTGGNKGIGLEVCRQLAGNGVTVVLTARDETRGAAAVENLRALGLSNVIFHQLEITDAPSIARLAGFLTARFGKLDILVNNAGVVGLEYLQDHIDGTSTTSDKFGGVGTYERIDLLLKWCLRETCDAGKACLSTNYHGTKRVVGALLPLLLASDDGRIVNVSSELGQLRLFGDETLRRELDDVESLGEARVDAVVAAFARDLEEGGTAMAEARGWPAGAMSAYAVSKAALNAYSRVLARRHPSLRVNCVQPGFVRTDMTVNFGLLPPEEGAARVVAVAMLPAGGPTGAYFQDRQQAPFV
ncbi:unnamed protein product [Urochloa humidicola]